MRLFVLGSKKPAIPLKDLSRWQRLFKVLRYPIFGVPLFALYDMSKRSGDPTLELAALTLFYLGCLLGIYFFDPTFDAVREGLYPEIKPDGRSYRILSRYLLSPVFIIANILYVVFFDHFQNRSAVRKFFRRPLLFLCITLLWGPLVFVAEVYFVKQSPQPPWIIAISRVSTALADPYFAFLNGKLRHIHEMSSRPDRFLDRSTAEPKFQELELISSEQEGVFHYKFFLKVLDMLYFDPTSGLYDQNPRPLFGNALTPLSQMIHFAEIWDSNRVHPPLPNLVYLLSPIASLVLSWFELIESIVGENYLMLEFFPKLDRTITAFKSRSAINQVDLAELETRLIRLQSYQTYKTQSLVALKQTTYYAGVFFFSLVLASLLLTAKLRRIFHDRDKQERTDSTTHSDDQRH